MALPDNVHLTKKGRAISAFLDQNPHASLTDIQRACDVGRECAVKWRGLWLHAGGKVHEPPPPTVRRDVPVHDPQEVFGRKHPAQAKPPAPEPDPAPVPTEPPEQEKTAPQPTTPPPAPEPPATPSDPPRKRIREWVI